MFDPSNQIIINTFSVPIGVQTLRRIHTCRAYTRRRGGEEPCNFAMLKNSEPFR